MRNYDRINASAPTCVCDVKSEVRDIPPSRVRRALVRFSPPTAPPRGCSGLHKIGGYRGGRGQYLCERHRGGRNSYTADGGLSRSAGWAGQRSMRRSLSISPRMSITWSGRPSVLTVA